MVECDAANYYGELTTQETTAGLGKNSSSLPGGTIKDPVGPVSDSYLVIRAFDLVEEYRDHVLVGLCLTGTRSKERQLAVIDRNASPISERMAILEEAHRRGPRAYQIIPKAKRSPATCTVTPDKENGVATRHN